MRAVPGHEEYVLYPYEQDYATSAERCRKMGERCGVTVEVEFDENTRAQAFWKRFKEWEGGIPGQKDSWRGASQWSARLNDAGDRIGIYVGHAEQLWMYIRAWEPQGFGAKSGPNAEVFSEDPPKRWAIRCWARISRRPALTG